MYCDSDTLAQACVSIYKKDMNIAKHDSFNHTMNGLRSADVVIS